MNKIQGKEAPNSKESEMMVLGCMLANENYLRVGVDSLSETDFFTLEHKLVFQAIKSVLKDEKPVDIQFISKELKRQEKLEEVGGIGFLMDLAQYAGTSALLEEYISDLKEYSKKRQLLYLAKKIEKEALEEGTASRIILDTCEEIKRIEESKGPKDKFPIQFLNQFDQNFLLIEPPKKQMLLEYADEKGSTLGFLPKGVVAMLVGAGGIGKTHLLAQLALSISSGTSWLGTFTTTKHCGPDNKGNVFIGLGENQYEDIHRVLYKASKKLRRNQPDLTKQDPLMEASARIAPFSFCGQQASFIENGKPSIYFRQLKNKLIDIAPEGGWSLIILDPISRLMGADAETDNAAATQFIALLEELTIDLPGNPTILFAHHVNKAAIREGPNQNQAAARGSSALTDGVRWQCHLIKDKDSIVMKMEKTNFTAIQRPIHLEKNEDGCLERSTKTQEDTDSKFKLEKQAKSSPAHF